MIITDVHVYPLVVVKRQYPTVISVQIHEGRMSPIEDSYFVLFEVVTDSGLRGVGEVSDIPSDALPDLVALAEELSGVLVGRSPYEIGPILRAARSEGGEPRTLGTPLYDCAIDMALYDLMGKAAGVPLHQLLGGEIRERIPISAVIYIRDPALIAEEVRERMAQGFRDFKLKVGLGIDHDEASLATLRATAGPTAKVKIDPNGAWSVDEAISNLRRLMRYDLAGVETPIPAQDLTGKLAIKRELTVPILEHVGDIRFALECARTGAVDVFNLALCSTGGIHRALKVAAIAEAAGIECLLGSTLELWPGTAAQAHFGAVVPGLGHP
ncbi:MAG: mandelate racemase/muconate lactonizing enzyme family protein, partial [Actinomycetota bacterium]